MEIASRLSGPITQRVVAKGPIRPFRHAYGPTSGYNRSYVNRFSHVCQPDSATRGRKVIKQGAHKSYSVICRVTAAAVSNADAFYHEKL
jgi:hypothetical protein